MAMNNSVAILCMLPEDFCSEIIEWGKKNIGDNLLSGINNKGREKGPHVTLATGIIDEQPEKAIDMISSIDPFEIELGQISTFKKPDKGYDVVKVEVISPILHSINSDILQNLEVKDPITKYNPHITIAYVAPSACDGLIGSDIFSGKRIPIKSLVYSDRGKGGQIIQLKQPEPLMESLDYAVVSNKIRYSIEEIEAYLADNNISIKSMSAKDIGSIIIRLSNISL